MTRRQCQIFSMSRALNPEYQARPIRARDLSPRHKCENSPSQRHQIVLEWPFERTLPGQGTGSHMPQLRSGAVK